MDFLTTFTSVYDNYIIRLEGVLPSAADALQCRFANAGTADAGANYYTMVSGATSITAVTSSALTGGSNVHNGGRGVNIDIAVVNANSTAGLKSLIANTIRQSDLTPTYAVAQFGTAYAAANAISGIRFFWSGGSNFQAVGRILIYGLANV